MSPVTWERSKCTRCHTMIPWYENIPILSYLILLGRCSRCNERISAQYPLIEMIGVLWAYALAKSQLLPLLQDPVAWLASPSPLWEALTLPIKGRVMLTKQPDLAVKEAIEILPMHMPTTHQSSRSKGIAH